MDSRHFPFRNFDYAQKAKQLEKIYRQFTKGNGIQKEASQVL